MLQPDAHLPDTILQEDLAATLAQYFFSQVRPCIDAKLLHQRSKVQAGREATEHASLDLTRRQPQFYSLASPVMEAQYCQLCESLSHHSQHRMQRPRGQQHFSVRIACGPLESREQSCINAGAAATSLGLCLFQGKGGNNRRQKA